MPGGISEADLMNAGAGRGFLDALNEGGQVPLKDQITAFMAEGGMTGAALNKSADRLHEERMTARLTGVGTAIFGSSAERQQDLERRQNLQRREARAREHAAGLVTNKGTMAAALASGETRGNLRDIVSSMRSGRPEDVRQAIAALEGQAVDAQDPNMQSALSALAQDAKTVWDQREGPGAESRLAILHAMSVDTEAQTGLRRQYRDLGRSLRTVAGRMQEGRPEMAERLRGMAGGFSTASGDALGGAFASQQQLIQELSTADPSDTAAMQQRDALLGALAREGGEAAALGQNIALQAERHTTLSGRGRRGQRGARERALSELTGGTFSSAEFTIGGRRVSGRRARAIINRGGEQAQELMGQLQQHMVRSGATEDEASALINQYQQATMGIGEGGRDITTGEASRIAEVADESAEGLRTAERKRLAQSMADRNPLDADRNKLLEEIKTAVKTMAGASGDGSGGEGAPNMSTPGGDGTSS